jgi:modulator of FtsH protease HflC
MNPLRLNILGLAFGAALLVLTQTLFVVDQRETALVFQFGQFQALHDTPGLKAKVPFLDSVVKYPKIATSLDHSLDREVTLLGQDRLVVDSFIYYRITNPLNFYKNFGTLDVGRDRIAGRLASTLRDVLSRYTLDDVLSAKRVQVMNAIRVTLSAQLKPMGLEIVDVRIRRADLPPQNFAAVMKRMTSERDREAKELRAIGEKESLEIRSRADRDRTVLLAEAERKAQDLRGAGDAEAGAIYAAAYNANPEFYSFYRSLEAYRRALASGEGTGETTMVLSPASTFMKYFRGGGQ